MIKTYNARQRLQSLSISFDIDGVMERVTFGGASLSADIPASFSTSNEKLIKAMDSSPMLGDYYEIHSIQLSDSEKNLKIKEESDAEVTEKVVSETEETQERGVSEGSTLTFSNFNSLRDYLIATYSVKATAVNSLAKATAFAAEKGITVAINKTKE